MIFQSMKTTFESISFLLRATFPGSTIVEGKMRKQPPNCFCIFEWNFFFDLCIYTIYFLNIFKSKN